MAVFRPCGKPKMKRAPGSGLVVSRAQDGGFFAEVVTGVEDGRTVPLHQKAAVGEFEAFSKRSAPCVGGERWRVRGR